MRVYLKNARKINYLLNYTKFVICLRKIIFKFYIIINVYVINEKIKSENMLYREIRKH